MFITLGAVGRHAIIDYNGVVRYHDEPRGRGFRPHSDGPVIDGRQVRYSVITNGVKLLDADFEEIRRVTPVDPLTAATHDFVLAENSYLFISFLPATRDYSDWTDEHGTPYSDSEDVADSVISEVSFGGTEERQWNSWDHLKIEPDCRVFRFTGEYAHLNSLQVIDGDVVASLRGCAQVIRIDRSSGTWQLEWKLGGTAPPRSDGTKHLEIVGDPLGEFCGQHQATLTDDDRIVLFDNGTGCLGSRKDQAKVSRVVEYDISSGTHASFVREFRRRCPGSWNMTARSLRSAKSTRRGRMSFTCYSVEERTGAHVPRIPGARRGYQRASQPTLIEFRLDDPAGRTGKRGRHGPRHGSRRSVPSSRSLAGPVLSFRAKVWDNTLPRPRIPSDSPAGGRYHPGRPR